MANYSFNSINGLPTPEPGTKFTRCNFMQKEAHTSIFAGIEGLVFEDCNLLNCDLPADAETITCLTVHKSFCSHLHPEWGLTECVDNCSHVIDTDVVTIDSVVVDTIYHREDTVVA